MDYKKEVVGYGPEDCHACGTEACEFDDEDFHDGVWNCPDCGEPQ